MQNLHTCSRPGVTSRKIAPKASEALHGCYAGGDDFDNVIVDWLIKEHLRPAVSPPGMDYISAA